MYKHTHAHTNNTHTYTNNTHTHTNNTRTKSSENPINYTNTLQHVIQQVILPVRGRTVEADKLQTVLAKLIDR